MGEGIHATKKFTDEVGAFRHMRSDITIGQANKTITRKWGRDFIPENFACYFNLKLAQIV